MFRYHRLNRFSVAITGLVLSAFLVFPSCQAQDKKPTVFRQHTVPLPGEGITGFTLLVPEGWKVEGGMQRTPPELRNMFTLTDLLVEAPDGRSIHFYPAISYRYSDYTQAQPMQPVDGTFFLAPPESIGQWILYMAQINPDPTITNLQLISEEPLPDLTRTLQQMFAGQMQELRQMQHAPGGEAFMDVGGTKVIFKYNQNGKPMEETFLVGWHMMIMRTYGRVAMANWGIVDMRSLAGPAGSDYINDPALVTIAQSIRYNPRYYEAMHRYYQRTFHRPPPKTVKQLQKNNTSVNDILYDGWKKRSGMTDAGQRREIDMIHERTPYTAPDGNTVYLSSHYQRVYSDGQDRYILSNDANWDPRTDSAFNGRQWQMLKPEKQ